MSQFSASLWGDEAFSAILSTRPFGQIIKIVSRDTSPPLYYICEYLWFKLFGSSEISIRALSFLFFLGTVFTVALIAKELGKKKTVFWATLLTFLNPFLFKYAFEGRMYSLLAFTTTLSFYCFIKVMLATSKQRFKWQIAYVLSGVAALYSHHFAVFAIFVQGVWSLIEIFCYSESPPAGEDEGFPAHAESDIRRRFLDFARNDKVWNLWVYPAILLLYTPWLPSLYYQTMLVESGFWLATPRLRDLAAVTLSFILGPEKYPLIEIAFFCVLILLIVRRWDLKHRVDWILFSWFLGPLVLTFVISQFFQSIFFDRYMLFAIPGFILLLVTRRRSIISPLILFVLAGILGHHAWFYFTNPTKRPFKEFSLYMKSELKKGGRIINWNSSAHHLWESKYYGIAGPIYSPSGPLPFYVGTAQMTQDDVIYKLPGVARLGVITSGKVEEVVLEDYKLIESRQFGELKGLWFEKESN